MAETPAAIMRRIASTGSPGPELPTRRPALTALCLSCAVSWAGDESDCWSCGRPATSTHTSPRSALQKLLDAVGATAARTPRARKGEPR